MVFFLILVVIVQTQAVTLNCTYSIRDVWRVQNVYTCTASGLELGDSQILTEVTQNHLPGLSNADVRAFVVDGETMRVAPVNLHTFFPNLEVYEFVRAQLDEITKENLQGFPYLRQFSVHGNNVQNIGNDLLHNNPSLESVAIGSGPLRHVAHDAFEHLQNLTTLHIPSAYCIDASVSSNRNEVLDLTFRLFVECPPTFAMTEEKFLGGLRLEREIDQHISNRINPMALTTYEQIYRVGGLEDRLDKLEAELRSIFEELQ